MTIWASVIVGAYMIIRGVACYAGGYINEFTMTEMIKDGLYAEIDTVYWAYVGSFVVLILIGAWWQYRAKRREVDSGVKHPYKGKGRY